ncbi:MAG TPA: glycosyltransferase family 4 protein, partial [Acidimicrobiales bacterium]|nr:glycosyltransferase family 4 protein [Acidimicrobiales bacterium]
MKRHLLVTNDFPPKVGGIQNYLWDLWSRLDPSSYVVLTASSDEGAAAFDAAQAERGIRIERVPGKILFFPTPDALAAVRAAVKEHEVDMVLLDPALPLGLLGPQLDTPYGVVLHGAEVTVPGRLPGSRAALARVLRQAELIVSAGRYPAAEARRVVPDLTASLVEVPPGVDLGDIVPLKAAERRAARTRLGLPATGPLLTSVSRLVPRKGMDVLIEAANRLAPSYPDLVVAIAGDGRELGHLREMAARSPVAVKVLGRVSQEDRAALLGAADIFVMACHNRWLGLEQEGFGIVFLEAAAAGVPQVAGDSGGASEAVLDGETGLVVDNPRNPGALAEALRTLLADPAHRRRMGRAARSRVQESFDNDVLASRLADALAGVTI